MVVTISDDTSVKKLVKPSAMTFPLTPDDGPSPGSGRGADVEYRSRSNRRIHLPSHPRAPALAPDNPTVAGQRIPPGECLGIEGSGAPSHATHLWPLLPRGDAKFLIWAQNRTRPN